jgi:ankyrin repeat protein
MEVLFKNCKNYEYINHVIENSLILTCDSNIQPIHLACYNTSLDIVKKLIDYGHKLNINDEENSNALHYASENNVDPLNIIKFLLEKGLEINLKNDIGYSAFHIICQYQSIEVIKFCIDFGASIEEPDDHGCYPIHYFCEFGDYDILKFILNLNINVNRNHEKTDTSPEELIYKNKKLNSNDKKEIVYLLLKKYFLNL